VYQYTLKIACALLMSWCHSSGLCVDHNYKLLYVSASVQQSCHQKQNKLLRKCQLHANKCDAVSDEFGRSISLQSCFQLKSRQQCCRHSRRHLENSQLMSLFQFAYHHQTSKGINDEYVNRMRSKGKIKKVVSIVLLDPSSAFEPADRLMIDIILRHLEESSGFGGSVLKWFKSFLTDRLQSDHPRLYSTSAWCSTWLS